MADVRVGPYRMTSDGNGWSVGTVKVRGEDSDNPGTEYLADVKYPGAFDHALKHLMDRHLRDSDARTLEEIREEITRFREMIRGALAARV